MCDLPQSWFYSLIGSWEVGLPALTQWLSNMVQMQEMQMYPGLDRGAIWSVKSWPTIEIVCFFFPFKFCFVTLQPGFSWQKLCWLKRRAPWARTGWELIDTTGCSSVLFMILWIKNKRIWGHDSLVLVFVHNINELFFHTRHTEMAEGSVNPKQINREITF